MKEAEQTGFKCIENAIEGGKSVINLFHDINESSTQDFIGEFKYLEHFSSSIQIRVNSAGGSVRHGWSIVDTIMNSGVPTEGVIVGIAASMASIVSIVAERTKMMDYASLMVHNPFFTSTSLVDVDDQQLNIFREQLIKLYMARLNKERGEITSLMKGEDGQDGTWMDAEMAVDKGFIQRENIIETPAQRREEISVIQNTIADVKAMIFNSSPRTNIVRIDAKDLGEKFDELGNRISSFHNKIFNTQTKTDKMLEEINAELGLEVNASTASAKAKIKDLLNRATELEKSNGVLEVTNTTMGTELKKAHEKVEASASMINELANRLKEFEAEKEAAVKAENDKLISEAVTDGRIPKDEKEVWANLLTSNPECAKTAIASLTAIGEKKPLSELVKASKGDVFAGDGANVDDANGLRLPSIASTLQDINARLSKEYA
ncbi:MAG: ATP-dependent Clp protease proteolytic subunit [Bacteroidota bacterium]